MTYETPSVDTYGSVEQRTLASNGEYPYPKFSVPPIDID
jgi:hypothetical protein